MEESIRRFPKTKLVKFDGKKHFIIGPVLSIREIVKKCPRLGYKTMTAIGS